MSQAALDRDAALGGDPAAAARAREDELLAACESLVGLALRAGAHEAEAFATRTDKASATFEKGDLKLAHVDEGASIGLRVFRDARLGFAATNQFDRAALETAARAAVALAAASPADPANRLPDARPVAASAGLAHAGLAAAGIEEAVDLGHGLVRGARAFDARISVDGASAGVLRVSQAIHSSRGVRAAESDALVTLSISGMALDGTEVGGFHYQSDAVRDPARIAPAARELVDAFARVTAGNLGAERARSSYQGPVLFSPDALLDLFVAPVLAATSAIAVQRGRSALATRLHERIASAGFTILDRPDDTELAGAGSFDREGQPALPFALVEDGWLRGWMYNGYAAAVAGRLSTGHARGGARSVPGLGAHAVSVAPGAGGSRADLVRALGRGLLVQRFSGSVDPASGDFSGVAKSSRWVEGGREVGPVRETLLSGNAYALLARIALVGGVAERVDGAARAPWALVDGVDVTAG
ncbi:MAG: TldD/PmbA family protein [Planctomycetes bacterium]|nr:TldD/PmbA family protein [Planctomycetota bacterium]